MPAAMASRDHNAGRGTLRLSARRLKRRLRSSRVRAAEPHTNSFEVAATATDAEGAGPEASYDIKSVHEIDTGWGKDLSEEERERIATPVGG